MNARTAAATIAAAVLLALTGCSNDSNASPASCKAAMAQQLNDAVEAGSEAGQGQRPTACNGVDDKTVQRIAAELVTDQASKAAEDAVESTAPTTPQISDECRAWIEGELTDGSDDIDATAGTTACADLSDTEMDQAIEAVYDDLAAQQDATTTP